MSVDSTRDRNSRIHSDLHQIDLGDRLTRAHFDTKDPGTNLDDSYVSLAEPESVWQQIGAFFIRCFNFIEECCRFIRECCCRFFPSNNDVEISRKLDTSTSPQVQPMDSVSDAESTDCPSDTESTSETDGKSSDDDSRNGVSIPQLGIVEVRKDGTVCELEEDNPALGLEEDSMGIDLEHLLLGALMGGLFKEPEEELDIMDAHVSSDSHVGIVEISEDTQPKNSSHSAID